MREQKWQRSSLRRLSVRLTENGHPVSHTTVGRLLKEMKYSLRANVKRFAGASHPDRDRQFEHIEEQKQAFLAAGLPVISVVSQEERAHRQLQKCGPSLVSAG